MQAVQIAKKMGGFTRKVEVECKSVEEAQQAARFGCDIIMLDNFEAKVKRSIPISYFPRVTLVRVNVFNIYERREKISDGASMCKHVGSNGHTPLLAG